MGFNMRRTLPLLVLLLLPACGSPSQQAMITSADEVATIVADTDASTAGPTARPAPTVTPVPTTRLVATLPVPSAVPTEMVVAPDVTEVSRVEPVTSEPAPPSGLIGSSMPRGQVGARPWTVMIDNHPGAYPQSGLDKAAVVIESLAEFGITRFMATYADGITPPADEIGPIRSTRIYFAQLAMSFHPIYVHAGGSPDGQQLVASTDQLVSFDADTQANYTYRDSRRKAPHNLYTSTEALRTFAMERKVVEFGDERVGYLYDPAMPGGTPAGSIAYYFEDRSSAAAWRWSEQDGVYFRSQRDTPHIDRITGEQLWTNNVVVMQVNGGRRAGDANARIDQEVIGSGQARIFRNGQVLTATWVKEGEPDPLRFFDGGGAEIRFAPGSIWIAVVPSLDRLTAE